MIWTIEAKEKARTACREWQGTPHRNRVALKGEGVDCVKFVIEVLVAAGIMTRPALPRYDERLGLLRKHNVIEDILCHYLHAEAHEPADCPAWGDVVICTVGQQSNHVGIIVDGMVWHCPGRGAVGPEGWEDWKPKTQSLVRIRETGYRAEPTLTWDQIRNRLPK